MTIAPCDSRRSGKTSHLGRGLVTECRSARQRTEPHWTALLTTHSLVTIFLLSTGGAILAALSAEATVYQCLDRAGKTVLSNKQSGLHNCQVFIAGTPESATPPSAAPIPQDPSSSVEPDMFPPFRPRPLPPDEVPAYDPPIPASPGPDRAPSSPSTHAEPCSPGFNPLNPLSRPPCARADQPAGQPSAPASVPPN